MEYQELIVLAAAAIYSELQKDHEENNARTLAIKSAKLLQHEVFMRRNEGPND